jgi:hypothetical protein
LYLYVCVQNCEKLTLMSEFGLTMERADAETGI